MRQAPQHEHLFDRSGGRLCLDFANTMEHLPVEEPLASLGDLLAFGRQSGVLTADEASRIEAEARVRPEHVEAALADVRALREVLYRIFQAVARGRLPAEDDVAALNAALPQALEQLELQKGADGFTWGWRAGPSLKRVLWPILRDAAELLTSVERSSVRECAADTCAWLFLDNSKNQSRRWCDMKVCGNRSKARRHYQRSRSPR
jgi:predicted RNA-binding Zn ribbon-like protein